MANLATVPVGTPSLFDDEDDDLTLVGHVSKFIKLGPEGEGLPQGSPTKELTRLRKPQKIRWRDTA